jgi:hypothetical protein
MEIGSFRGGDKWSPDAPVNAEPSDLKVEHFGEIKLSCAGPVLCEFPMHALPLTSCPALWSVILAQGFRRPRLHRGRMLSKLRPVVSPAFRALASRTFTAAVATHTAGVPTPRVTKMLIDGKVRRIRFRKGALRLG